MCSIEIKTEIIQNILFLTIPVLFIVCNKSDFRFDKFPGDTYQRIQYVALRSRYHPERILKVL